MSGNRTPPFAGRCRTCGKKMYNSRKSAKAAAKALHPADHFEAYQCGDFWHFGHMASAISRGIIDRRTMEHIKPASKPKPKPPPRKPWLGPRPPQGKDQDDTSGPE